MFKEMRRKDRQLEHSEALDILNNCNYGILSTMSKNGYPYGVPVSYVAVDDSIYFHCAVEGNKLENIMDHDKVSFCVVGQTCTLPEEFSTNYESVVIFGRAIEAFDNEKNMALLEILKKYSPEYMESGKAYIEKFNAKTKVIKISMEHISGKSRR